MSRAKLPDCPSWCAQSHQRPGLPHHRNIDTVGKAAGHVSVEVNLIQDDEGPYVQVALTDHALPASWQNERVTLTRLSIDAAGCWGHIGTEMDHRGALQVAELLVDAANMFWREHCSYLWCAADHADPEWQNVHTRIEVVDQVEVITFTDENPTVEGDAKWVRITPKPGSTLKLATQDLNPGEALDLANLFRVLAAVTLGPLAEAITRAANDLGATDEQDDRPKNMVAPKPPVIAPSGGTV